MYNFGHRENTTYVPEDNGSKLEFT